MFTFILFICRHVLVELRAISFTVSAIPVAIMSGLTGINHLLGTGLKRCLLCLVITVKMALKSRMTEDHHEAALGRQQI